MDEVVSMIKCSTNNKRMPCVDGLLSKWLLLLILSPQLPGWDQKGHGGFQIFLRNDFQKDKWNKIQDSNGIFCPDFPAPIILGVFFLIGMC